jgi:hypothetical protein
MVRFNVWRRVSPQSEGEALDESEGRPAGSEIRDSLETRGVAADFAASLAVQLEPRMSALDAAARTAMLDGVALALDLQRETGRDLARSLRGLKEVERMMGAFSGELSKLDEVLEVLAAYVRRMKTSGASSPEQNRTLH